MILFSIINSKLNRKQMFTILFAIFVFLAIAILLPDTFTYSARMMTAIVCFGVILWALEPFPIGLTALIILLLILLLQVVDLSVAFSGFASPAIYLIIGGMMLAKAVNETNLLKRVTYHILKKWGHTANGLLGSIIVILQIKAFFIPATAVRTTLILPTTELIIKIVNAKPDSNLRKMLMLGVAYGGNISGTAIMTAAIGNILTVELLKQYANVKLNYFQWFLYTFPLWIILIPAIWYLLIKLFPLRKDEREFPHLRAMMEKELERLGKMDKKEWRTLIILCIIVALWLTESLHGLNPTVVVILGVVLLALPVIGNGASWEKIVSINYNTVILLSVTLSIGYGLIESGAVKMISHYLSQDFLLTFIQNPVIGVVFVIVLTQFIHKLISNVSTAVVTLVPIFITISINANINPMLLGFTTGLTSLYGFVLAVETMPNLVVYSTGLIKQRDFYRAGFFATVVTTIATIIVALTWWRLIGIM